MLYNGFILSGERPSVALLEKGHEEKTRRKGKKTSTTERQIQITKPVMRKEVDVPITEKRKRKEVSKKEISIVPHVKRWIVLEGKEQGTSERHNVSEHQEQEELVEGCTLEFPSWSILVKRRSSWGKEKAIESQLAPLGIGIAANVNPEEMMDTFFVNNVQGYTTSDDHVLWYCNMH